MRKVVHQKNSEAHVIESKQPSKNLPVKKRLTMSDSASLAYELSWLHRLLSVPKRCAAKLLGQR